MNFGTQDGASRLENKTGKPHGSYGLALITAFRLCSDTPTREGKQSVNGKWGGIARGYEHIVIRYETFEGYNPNIFYFPFNLNWMHEILDIVMRN